MDGQILRALRLRRGETQAEFAAHFGVSRTNVTNWEKTRTPKHGIGGARVDVIVRKLELLSPKEKSGG